MIGITVVLVIAAIAIPNILMVVRKNARNEAIARVVSAERAWRTEKGAWLSFEKTAQPPEALGAGDVDCEFSAAAETGSNGALVLTVLCPNIDSVPVERRIEP